MPLIYMHAHAPPQYFIANPMQPLTSLSDSKMADVQWLTKKVATVSKEQLQDSNHMQATKWQI